MKLLQDIIRKLSFPLAFLILLFVAAGCASSHSNVGQAPQRRWTLRGKITGWFKLEQLGRVTDSGCS